MTTTAASAGTESGRPHCGCCGRPRPAGRLAELGSTPGVFVCAWCGLWAARRASRLPRVQVRHLPHVPEAALRRLRRQTSRGDAAEVLLAIPVMPSADLGRTADYYLVLGFEVVERHDEYLVLHSGGVELHFIGGPSAVGEPAGMPGSGKAPVFLYVRDAAALWKRLHDTGAAGVGPIEDQPHGLREFVLSDPDGNKVRVGSSIPCEDG